MRRRPRDEGFPRLRMALFLALSGLVAFLTTWLLLRFGITSMGLRYPVAVAAGYATLLALLGVWKHVDLEIDGEGAVDIADAVVDATDLHVSSGVGIGASDGSSSSSSSSGGFSFDADDGAVVLVVAALALTAAIACAYVVWDAPILFAELLADGAIVAGGYRRMKRRARNEPNDWLSISIRRPWIPAAVLVVFFGVGGFTLEALTNASTMGAALGEVLEAE